MKKDDIEKNFKYSYLNKMLYFTLSKNQTWFLESLISSKTFSYFPSYDNGFYMFYVSMYLYSVMQLKVNGLKELQDNIDFIINFDYTQDKTFSFNWLKCLKFFYDKKIVNSNFLILLLNKLFYFKDLVEIDSFLFEANDRDFSCISKDSFNDEFILRCWLDLILSTNYYFEFESEKMTKLINELNKERKEILINLFKERKYKGEFLTTKTNRKSFVTFYKLINDDFNVKNSEKVNLFFENLLNESSKENNINTPTKEPNDEKVKYLKDKIYTKFKYLKLEDFNDIFNDRLEIDKDFIKEEIIFYDFKYETPIHIFKNKIPSIFNEIIRNSLNKLNNNSETKFNKIDDLYELLNELNPENIFKSSNLYLVREDKNNIDLINKLNKIETSFIWSDDFIIWKKDAIEINYLFDQDNLDVRKLNTNEINRLIDEKYRVSNGFYKYIDNDKGTRFISRSELFDIIKNNFYIAIIILRYKIKIDSKNIYVYKNPYLLKEKNEILNRKYIEAAKAYLVDGMSLIDIEKKVLMTYSLFSGLSSKRILNNLGIDTSYSNSLKGKINNLNIDDYINHSTSTFKNTLLKIKKRYLS